MEKTIIKDKLNRPLRDLRISVIDRCNFRCQYCMPADKFGPDFQFLPRSALLTYEEIERLGKIFVSLGVEKIRLTGGEPLMRKDMPLLVQKLSRIEGLTDIGLTTNGVLLSKLAQELKDAGLKRVNVSLDTLNDELFGKINGRGIGTQPVLEGIRAAKEAGLGVKINMVVKKGLNDSEVIPMASYCKDNGLELRYIEFMDYGKIEKASGGTVRQRAKLAQGIDKENAKKINTIIKNSGVKVKSQVQDDQVRVTGKSRDDLQKIISLVREADLTIDVQFINYR